MLLQRYHWIILSILVASYAVVIGHLRINQGINLHIPVVLLLVAINFSIPLEIVWNWEYLCLWEICLILEKVFVIRMVVVIIQRIPLIIRMSSNGIEFF